MQKNIPQSFEPGLNHRFSEQLHHKLDHLVRALVSNDIDLQFAKQQLEHAYIREVLKAHQGNIGRTAQALGVHRNTLSKRIKDLKIDIPKSK
ncbi:MAG: helix-turn-helix domain-containing protein [Acidobacteriota bacterium]|nr:helix-turn-helix domain-containing protein [Acidobacteriota bacterium]